MRLDGADRVGRDRRSHRRRARRPATPRGVTGRVLVEHDPERTDPGWVPVFGNDHAPAISSSTGSIPMTEMLSRDHLITSVDSSSASMASPTVRRSPRRPTASPRTIGPSSRRRRSLRWRRAGPTGWTARHAATRPASCASHDEKTLLVPDRRGNNRIDSLRNILHDPRVALLFLIPGCGETIRVNGRAAISTDPALTPSFIVNGKTPRAVLVVTVERDLLPVRQGDRALAAVGRRRARSSARACRAPARSSPKSPTASSAPSRTTAPLPSA